MGGGDCCKFNYSNLVNDDDNDSDGDDEDVSFGTHEDVEQLPGVSSLLAPCSPVVPILCC